MPTAPSSQENSTEADADQFATDLTALAAKLRAYARRLARTSTADADDLLQDTMLRCWASRHRFEPGTSLIAWAHPVMRNSFISGRRRARFHAELPEAAVERLLAVAGTQEVAVHLTDVRWALGELSADHRDAVLLAGEGVSSEEGAALLAIPEGTFKSRVWRGRSRLHELTEDRSTSAKPVTHVAPMEPPRPKVPPLGVPRRRRSWKGVMIG